MTIKSDERIRSAYKEDEKENIISSLKVENAELRIALSRLLESHARLVNSGDCGDWNVETEEEVIFARKVLAPRDFRSSMRGMKL